MQTPALPPIPNIAKILGKLRIETLTLEATDYGHKLIVEGGTLLSPTAWTGVTYASLLLEHLTRVAR